MGKQINGVVYLVGAGPGDPGLITLRGLECLRQAEVVVYDRLVNRLLLSYAPQAELIDVGKRPDHHPIPQEQINALLVERGQAGQNVVRLKGGDPFVFGRGGEEALALAKAGVPFEVVPGVTSAIAAPAYAGIPITQRGAASSVAFIAGHGSEIEQPNFNWEMLAHSVDTLVFLMGVQNLPMIVPSLLAAGRSPDTPVALIQQGTLPAQKVVIGTLQNILQKAASIQPPAITIVGEVVRLHQELHWFDPSARRPLLGRRIINTRPAAGEDALALRLTELGAAVIPFPATRLDYVEDLSLLDESIYRLGNDSPGANGATAYDWVLFTSAHAVTFFCRRLFALGFDARSFGRVKLGVVGQATDKALQAFGLRADLITFQQTGAALALELPDPSGKHILLPRSDHALPDILRILQKRGGMVEAVITYTTQPAAPDPANLEILIHQEADAITFFSPSAIEGVAAQLAASNEVLASLLKPLAVVCVGPTTASAARNAGLRVDQVAEEASVEAVCQALVKHFSSGNQVR